MNILEILKTIAESLFKSVIMIIFIFFLRRLYFKFIANHLGSKINANKILTGYDIFVNVDLKDFSTIYLPNEKLYRGGILEMRLIRFDANGMSFALCVPYISGNKGYYNPVNITVATKYIPYMDFWNIFKKLILINMQETYIPNLFYQHDMYHEFKIDLSKDLTDIINDRIYIERMNIQNMININKQEPS